MAKMDVSKVEHEQSTNVTEEYGGNIPPVGTSPRMLQLTIPQSACTNFNSNDNRLQNNAHDELQRALATVVGEKRTGWSPNGNWIMNNSSSSKRNICQTVGMHAKGKKRDKGMKSSPRL